MTDIFFEEIAREKIVCAQNCNENERADNNDAEAEPCGKTAKAPVM